MWSTRSRSPVPTALFLAGSSASPAAPRSSPPARKHPSPRLSSAVVRQPLPACGCSQHCLPTRPGLIKTPPFAESAPPSLRHTTLPCLLARPLLRPLVLPQPTSRTIDSLSLEITEDDERMTEHSKHELLRHSDRLRRHADALPSEQYECDSLSHCLQYGVYNTHDGRSTRRITVPYSTGTY